jgi:apolipoprotein N-acyltransferase
VGAAAAFASPPGLGPLLVAAGAVIAAEPASVDARLARWPEVFDGLIALPALAGLASVAAAQPSERGLAVGAGAGVLAVVSWWRGPRHGDHEPRQETVIAYLGAIVGILLAFAPELFSVLGVLPAATVQAGRGLASGLAVFALATVLRQVGTLRANRAAPTAAHRR